VSTTPTIDDAQVAALGVALDRLYERAQPVDQVVGYVAGGWTVEAFGYVELLALWALAHETGVTVDVSGSDEQRLRTVTESLFMAAHWTRGWKAPIALAVSWAAVEAAGPTEAAAAEVDDLLFGGDAAGRTRVLRWLALGAAGPLAWAAGLSIEEAEARGDALAGEVEDLRTLAALRGWVLPDQEIGAWA
jgi:hypothetical protein